MQLDITKEEVIKIINGDRNRTEQERYTKHDFNSDSSLLGMFYLDAVVNIDSIIKSAQLEMWKSLKGGMAFNISTEDSQSVLARLSGSKTTFVILYIDIVGSTRLAMTLPVDKLAAIIRAFTHEISLIVSAYGGYVLKYLGDAIMAFFPVTERKLDLNMPCINAVQCARAMVKTVKVGFNPVLLQEDYPDLNVRVGIDVGEAVVVQYGWSSRSSTKNGGKEQSITKTPLHDILGYTVSVASKITGVAEPNQIVIGQSVYDALDNQQRFGFRLLNIPPDKWNYESSKTGNLYKLYVTTSV